MYENLKKMSIKAKKKLKNAFAGPICICIHMSRAGPAEIV